MALVDIDEIDWIESAGNYVRIHAASEIHRTRGTLSGLHERLGAERFVRVHRTIIVNVDRIHHITPHFHGDGAVVLRDGTKLNLSRRYRPCLQHFLQRYSS